MKKGKKEKEEKTLVEEEGKTLMRTETGEEDESGGEK